MFILTGAAGWHAITDSSKVKGEIAPSPTSQITEGALPTHTPIPLQDPTTTSAPPTVPVEVHTPAPSTSWHYPKSTITASSGTVLTLSSNDNADTIAEWYKKKISEEGYAARSFVTTTTNGQVENVLVGANGEHEIRIEMKKQADSPTTIIRVINS